MPQGARSGPGEANVAILSARQSTPLCGLFTADYDRGIRLHSFTGGPSREDRPPDETVAEWFQRRVESCCMGGQRVREMRLRWRWKALAAVAALAAVLVAAGRSGGPVDASPARVRRAVGE